MSNCRKLLTELSNYLDNELDVALKAEIDAKLQAKGVKVYTLEIVPNENVKDEKVVGSCDGGSKKLTYVRK